MLISCTVIGAKLLLESAGGCSSGGVVEICTCTYKLYNNISGDGGSGGGSVLMGAILLRQMLICYIVKTPDGLTDSEI